MSTSSEIQSVRQTEQRYPCDLIRHGKTYRYGYRRETPAMRRAVRRVRMLRTHRVTV